MNRFEVVAPGPQGAADRSLGRLAPALTWLGAVQGTWPPQAPTAVRRVSPSAGGAQDEALEDRTALTRGVARADALADDGADLVLLSCPGDQVPGIVAAAALLDLEPVQAVGTAAGADWAALTVGVRNGLRQARPHLGDVEALAGDGPLAEATGLLAQCAVRRTPVVLDGTPQACAAALLAERLAPGASAWWLAGQVPPNPAAAAALWDLGRTPLLDLGLALPLGAELALTVLLAVLPPVQGPGSG